MTTADRHYALCLKSLMKSVLAFAKLYASSMKNLYLLRKPLIFEERFINSMGDCDGAAQFEGRWSFPVTAFHVINLLCRKV